MGTTKKPRGTVADFIKQGIQWSARSEKEIAEEAGYQNPEVIRMMAEGLTKVPVGDVAALARAMQVNPSHLLRLVLLEYMPDTWDAIESIFETTIPTKNEVELLRVIRKATNDTDPSISICERSVVGVLVAGAVSDSTDGKSAVPIFLASPLPTRD